MTPTQATVSDTQRTPEEIFARIQLLKAEAKRRVWADDPVIWAEEKLGDVLWSGQKKILYSVRDHRRTAAPTCHEVGKSYDAGILAGWWIDSHKLGEAFVVTTAPTGPQVQVILWKEIGRVFSRGALQGRINQVEWLVLVKDPKTGIEREEIVALGRKPSDYSPTAFQGIHAPYVLVIVDEANGVRGPLWEAIDSLIANDNSKIIAIGNPDDPTGEFYDHCKPGSGWNVVQLGAFESPNFTSEPMPAFVSRQLIGKTYVEEKRRKWAPRWHWVDRMGVRSDVSDGVKCVPPSDAKPEDTNPLWQSKVLGLFPEKAAAGGLIPISWVTAAQQRNLEPGYPNHLGVDVGAGGDESSVCHRRGSVYRIIRTDNDPDTMSQCGKIVNDLILTGATDAKIDKIGIGWGIVNRGQELKKEADALLKKFPGLFHGINVGEAANEEDAAADDDRFLNLKAQLWWNVRDLFERGDIDIDPDDEDLAAELVNIRYERMSTGKIKISDKHKDAHGKTIASPNRAESLMLAAAPVPAPKESWVTW